MENCRLEERKEIGRRIGMVRRSFGLSHVEFAQRLCMPQWMTEIAEHGICDGGRIVDAVSPFAVDMPALVREIAIEFDVSPEWLLTGEGVPPVSRGSMHGERVVYVPITISAKYFEEELSRMMQVLDLSRNGEYSRAFAKRLTLKGLLDLMQNYIHDQRQSGRAARMEEMIGRMRRSAGMRREERSAELPVPF